MPCRRGDVVLVPFPFSDATATKRRPAVVISAHRFNAENLDCLVVAVTHNPHAVHRSGAVSLDDSERRAGGLDKSPVMIVSVAISSKVASIAQTRVVATLGHLSPETVDRIVHALVVVLR